MQQSPASLVLQEGENAELQCTYSTTLNSMQWFYQRPGGRLVSLLYSPSWAEQRGGRLTSSAASNESRSSLHISSSQITDSGTYLCAMEPQCSPHTCSLHTNLQLGGRGPLQSQDIRKPPHICVAYCLFLVWVEFHPRVSFGPCRFTFAFIFISQYILPPEIAVFNSELTEADGMTEST